jgi:hypothetical protein
MRAAPFAACLATIAVARSASAEPVRHVDLVWSRTEQVRCIGAEELSAAVERTLGRPVFHGESPASAKIVGDVHAAANGHFDAHIRLVDASGKTVSERELGTDADCKRLDESIAVVVTLMIDGLEEAPTPLRVPPEPPRPPPPVAAPTPSRPPKPETEVPVLAVGAGAGLSSSLLPGTAGAAVLRAEVAPQSFVPIALTGRMFASSDATLAGAGGAFSAWDAELAACPRWQRETAAIGACAGIGGGAISGRSLDLSAGQSHTRALVVVPILAQGALRLYGPLWLRAEAGVLVPLLRERWGFRDSAGAYVPVFQPDSVAPTGSVGLELRTGS